LVALGWVAYILNLSVRVIMMPAFENVAGVIIV
jgi:hypothetical protein